MAIKIGTVESTGDPSAYERTPDDRLQKTDTVGGIIIEDFGYIEDGLEISVTATFAKDDWNVIEGYWVNRTPVTVVDHRGRAYTNRLIKVAKMRDEDGLDYITAELKIWHDSR